MYCSSCGNEIKQGLVYCNKCGKRIAEDGPAQQGVSVEMFKAVGFISSAAFFAFIFVVYVFLRSGAPSNQLIPISFFFFAALFGICLLLLRFGWSFTVESSSKPELSNTRTETPDYFKPSPTHRLSEPADPGIASVTEHTTRTLDKVPARKN
jgi:hypothetical protein